MRTQSRAFATHWDGAQLAPGENYQRDASYKGDLVFYVPEGAGGDQALKGSGWRGFVDNGQVLGLAPYAEWGPRQDPQTV